MTSLIDESDSLEYASRSEPYYSQTITVRTAQKPQWLRALNEAPDIYATPIHTFEIWERDRKKVDMTVIQITVVMQEENRPTRPEDVIEQAIAAIGTEVDLT